MPKSKGTDVGHERLLEAVRRYLQHQGEPQLEALDDALRPLSDDPVERWRILYAAQQEIVEAEAEEPIEKWNRQRPEIIADLEAGRAKGRIPGFKDPEEGRRWLLKELRAQTAPPMEKLACRTSDTEEGPLVEEQPSSRQRAENLIDEGVGAFDRGGAAPGDWVRKRLKRKANVELLAAVQSLLESWKPPQAQKTGELLSSGEWVEYDRPVARRTLSYWMKGLRNPVAYFRSILRLRVWSRRIDAARAVGRGLATKRSDKQVENLAATAAASDDETEASEDLAALIQAAEACGIGLSPLELKVTLCRDRGERCVMIAFDLNLAASTVRVAASRGRKKLERAGRHPL